MGGRKSSLFCIFCSFSGRNATYGDDEEPRYTTRKIRPSYEDRGCWVGDPFVDKKAADFIAKFHESRFMDLENRQAIPV